MCTQWKKKKKKKRKSHDESPNIGRYNVGKKMWITIQIDILLHMSDRLLHSIGVQIDIFIDILKAEH